MGLIPTLLNIYQRNKRYSLQKQQYDKDREEREREKNQQRATQLLSAPRQDINFEFYDPYKGYNQQIGR